MLNTETDRLTLARVSTIKRGRRNWPIAQGDVPYPGIDSSGMGSYLLVDDQTMNEETPHPSLTEEPGGPQEFQQKPPPQIPPEGDIYRSV